MDPRPIETLELSVLLAELRDHEREIVTLVDEDPLLKRRRGGEDGELVIANSGPALFEPKMMHQLFAKGIVYHRDTLEVVSIPLIKMFNHGLREHSDATTREVLGQQGVRIVFPEKLDGTMIQLFASGGRVWLTTRSVLEGAERAEEGPYLALARGVLERDAPHMLDPEFVGRRTLIFELVHPKTRQVTRYGVRESMVLLSVYDQREWRYWTTAEVLSAAEEWSLDRPKMLVDSDDLERGVAQLKEVLADDVSVPEGSIVCLERDGQIVHRVKVKMDAYLAEFSMKFNVSLKSVVEQIWEKPEWHDWPTYLAHISDEGLSEEEVEAFYKEHHDAFTAWYAGIRARYERVLGHVEALEAAHGACPEGPEARREYFKVASGWVREHAGGDFGLVMQSIRKGELTLEHVMWSDPVYPGFRGVLSGRLGR